MFTFNDQPIWNPNEDGITHINTYSRSRTELGRLMSNFAHTPFCFEPYGHFESAEGFWYWYFTGQQHDALRGVVGWEAKKVGRLFEADRIDSFGILADDITIITEMLVHKTASTPKLYELLKESTLPFCHYYCPNGVVQIIEGLDWFNQAWEDIRSAIKS